MRSSLFCALRLALCASLFSDAPLRAQSAPSSDRIPEAARQKIVASSLQVPLAFESNRGQTDRQVKYLSRGNGYTLFLTPGEAVLSLRRPTAQVTSHESRVTSHESKDSGPTTVFEAVRLRLLGANLDPAVTGLDEQPGVSNYFIGNDPATWRTNVPLVGKVRYEGVYPGIDLVYYGNQRRLEHDFVVAPGADPGLVRFEVDGADSLCLDADGNLVLHTSGGEVVLQAPVAYQEIGGVRRPVESRYVVDHPSPLTPHPSPAVAFAVGRYDTSHPLVIDPILSYSTYLGGSGPDQGNAIAVDGSGNAYVTGQTGSTNFPTAGAYQVSSGGGTNDVFVTKLNASGSALVYSTYLGGSGDDQGNGIAVDGSGNAYVAGRTTSTNFPTASAYQASSGGGTDAFVIKLNSSGSALTYSTYLGGSGVDQANDIAVDLSGNAYVAGRTISSNFPTAGAPYQASYGGGGDAFVTKLNAVGSALTYSTYLGGSGVDEANGIAVYMATGDAFVTGYTQSMNFPTATPLQMSHGGGTNDAFVTKLNASGSALTYSTYLGGSGSDTGYDIAVDNTGNAYVTGSTSSTNFPTTNPYQASNGGGTDAFVTKFNSAGSTIYSTYLGGAAADIGYDIAVDSANNAYVTGQTGSTNFPTASPYQASSGGGVDAFVTRFNSAGSALTYSTYLGGSGPDIGNGIAVDGLGAAYIAGQTSSTNFPTASYQNANAGGDDAFVTKITLKPVIFSIMPTSGNPGVSVTLTGSGFSSTAASNTVFFGATKASVMAASATSLTVTVPTGATFGPISVTAGGEAAISRQFFLPTFTSAAPGIDANSLMSKMDFATGSTPYNVGIGDLDGDGKPDLVVTNFGGTSGATLSVFRNTSTSGVINSSSFAAKVDLTTGTGPDGIGIGDLDGDGKLDLAVANNTSNTVSVYRNTSTSGTISFATKVDFPTGTTPFGVGIGDLDGDGKPELVVTNLGSNTVSMFRNTSVPGTIDASSFASKIDLTAGSDPRDIVICDLDGDGKLDLAVTNYGGGSGATLSVFRNTSTPGVLSASSFAAKVDFTTGSGPEGLGAGDIDGDGKLDLVAANNVSNTVSVLRNTSTSGTVSFAAKTDFAAGVGPFDLALVDLNGDGKPDPVVTNYGGASGATVSVLRNTSTSGTVSLASKADFATGTGPNGMAAGDVDGDGIPDLIVANYSSNTVSVLRNALMDQSAQLSATALAFGNVEKGSSPTATFTVTNAGGGTLTVTGITSNNPRFTVSPTSFSLVASASQTVTATFSPTFLGAQAGTLTVTHNAPGSPSSVALSGTGIDTTPPSAPSGLSATAGNNQVTLNWTANTEPDLSYYIVYRSTVNGFTPTSAEDIAHVTKPSAALGIAYVASPGTSYTSTGLTAGTYYFKVAAADSAGNKSGASAQASATLAPGYSPSSSSLSLGSVNVGGTPGTQTFTVSNAGMAALTVSGITVSGTDAAQFTVSPTTFTVNAGGSPQTVTVTFTPTGGPGSRSASLSVAHNASGSPATVSLTGTSVDVTPPSAPTGLTAAAGNNQVSLSWTANAESDLSYYIVYRNLGSGFTPAAADSVGKVNKPGTAFTNTGLSAGTYYYKIAAVDSSGNKSGASAQASATLAPGYSQSSFSLSFGNVTVGGTAGTQTFTVSNTGTSALTVSGITVSGMDAAQFTVSPTTFTVNAGGSPQTVTATLTPTGGPGSRSASLSVAHNASGSPATVTLTGTALAPIISLPATTLAFGDVAVGKSTVLNLSVQNTGTANLSISTVTVTGADASQFQVTFTTSTVTPGQSAVVAVVAFAPTSSGVKSASLSITHNAAGSPSSVSLSGTGLPGRISVLTTALNFGELEAGKNKVLTLTVSNPGVSPLTVSAITSSNARFTVSETAFTVPAGSSKEISITFSPSAEGALAAALSISSNDPDKPTLQVSLSGSGIVIRPVLSVSPASLDFGDVFIGQKKALTLTVANTGRATLNVSEVKVEDTRFSVSYALMAPASASRELSAAAATDAFSLAPNARREVSVTFQPANTDPLSTNLLLRSNDPETPERRVPLAGKGQTPPPEVDIRAENAGGQPLTTGRAPLTVKFTATNTGGPVTIYAWNFGDGSPPGETRDAVVTYTYAAPGTYTVTLKATGPGGSVTKVKERLITVLPTVEANFSAAPTSGKAPLTVAFTDASQGSVTSWSWEFGDGETSAEQNPKHIYKKPGVYTVKLTVRGANNTSDTKTKENLVSVPPVADFAAAPVSGLDSLKVAFADSSKGATSWSWEFGDGETSTEQNPKHTYKKPGVYTVKLTVKGPGGSDIKEQRGLIQVKEGVKADFTASPTSGRAPLVVKFTDASKGEITSRSWEFGDGETSTEQNPSHTYTRVDNFTVTLKATGPVGSDTKTVQKLIVVVLNKPPAAPVPRSPAKDAVGVSLTPTLTWDRSVDPEDDPVTYDVFLNASRVQGTPNASLTVGPLTENTDYTWRVVAKDDRGGAAEGPTLHFGTVGDTQAPAVLSGPVMEGITRTGATARWTTDESSRPQVEYRIRGEAAFTASARGPLGASHRIDLAGLSPGATYEYRVLSRDAAGNGSTFPAGPPYPTFTTLTVADTTPPQFVVPPSAPFISDTSAVIVWTTDERSASEVAFRLESEVNFTNAPPGEAGTEHRVVLNGLQPGSAYVFRARSVDASGNAAFVDLRVVTLPRSVAPASARLRIFNVSVVGRTESQAIVEWSTDRPASGLVRYGLTSLLNPSLTQTGEGGALEHRVTLTRLNPDTEYFYRAISAASPADSSDVFSFRTRAAARVTPPVILEGPVAQGIGQDRATILWKTDEVSSSAVEFDTTAVLSTRVVTVPEQVVDHAVTLTGLASGKTYSYRVRSTGLTRLSAVSDVLSFITPEAKDTTPPTFLEGPAVTARTPSGFTVEWQTDELSTSEVAYGQPDGPVQSQTAPGLVQRHRVSVGGLRPETRYAFRVRSADAAGNVREGDLLNVTTLSDALVDRTSPRIVSPPSVIGTTHQTATIGWETDEPANSLVEFGRKANDLSEVQGEARVYVTGHRVVLTDLSAATTYHYRISSTDVAGNGPTKNAGDLAFTTKAAPDLTPARITSGPTVVSTTDQTAVVEWGTDKLSDSQVDYAAGENVEASRLTQQVVSSEAATVHRITLIHLTPKTTYTFRVGSQDVARNARTFSVTRTLQTLDAPDLTQPDLVNVPTSAEVTSGTATLLWTTDEPTSAIVEYGMKDYNTGRIERGTLERSHTLTLTGLQVDTEYQYRITSRDREGNGVTTDPTITIPPPRTRLRSLDLRFRTAKVADTTPPVIVEGPTVQISGNNVVVRWVTDELSNSRVVYATPANYNRPGLESDVFDARLVTVHLVTLAGLDLNTQYLFRCVSSDASGNTVASGGPRSTKPTEGLALQPPGGDGGFVTAPVADRQPPVILSGPTLVGATSTSLTMEWQTDEASDSFVEYGPGERTVSRAEDGTPVTRHRLVLTKLTPGTAYRLVAGSADPSRNGPTRSKPAVGATAAEVDVTPPKILGSAAVSYRSDRQAIITWRTDEPASSTVEYGPGTETTQVRSIPEAATEHKVVLTNLAAGTAYSFRAGSLDASNNGPTWTQTLTFKTDPTPDTTPPRILGEPKVLAITDQAASVTWQTDELSDSAVRFGTSAASLDFNVGAPEAVTDHRLSLTNLKSATTYFLRVNSIDRSGNGPTVSPELGRTVSFTTAAAKDTIPPAQLKAVLGLAGSRVVVLSWPSSPEPDLAGYNVYRGAGDEALRLIASNLAGAHFRDEGVTDETTYRYAVTALDRAGNEGPKSNAASLTPSGKNAPTAPKFRARQGKPLTPTFVVENATSPRGTTLIYTFQVSAREDFADVAVSATGVKEGNESTEKGVTAWTVDRELTDRATYYLRVRANDGAFDGPFSPALAFRVDANAAERPGDFNGDFAVDFEDFFLFAGAFGKKAAGEDARFDLVANGVVDFEDFFAFAGVFGKRYAR